MADINEQMALLAQIRTNAEEIQIISIRIAQIGRDWETAVRAGDGVKENELRQQMHTFTDQALDLRVSGLQLVKKFESL